MAAKKLRPFQDLESCVCLHDMMEHGNKTVEEKLSDTPSGHVAETHWFSLLRRYVSAFYVLYQRSLNKVLDDQYSNDGYLWQARAQDSWQP